MKLSLYELYQLMLENMGPTGWWPADTKEQIMVEAILIQNTTERNATKASNLIRNETNYHFNKILSLETEILQDLVHPAGFMTNKTKAIQTLAQWYLDHNQSSDQITQTYQKDLRARLLKLHGVGPETADVLLTYVFDQPYFIADKYARTLFSLLGVKTPLPDYRSLHQHLAQLPASFTPEDAKEFHGLIDEFGKAYFHPIEKFKTSFLANYTLDWEAKKSDNR